VVGTGRFVEVYVDDVLVLQFVIDYYESGHFGLRRSRRGALRRVHGT